jgi:hypothetical protein
VVVFNAAGRGEGRVREPLVRIGTEGGLSSGSIFSGGSYEGVLGRRVRGGVLGADVNVRM